MYYYCYNIKFLREEEVEDNETFSVDFIYNEDYECGYIASKKNHTDESIIEEIHPPKGVSKNEVLEVKISHKYLGDFNYGLFIPDSSYNYLKNIKRTIELYNSPTSSLEKLKGQSENFYKIGNYLIDCKTYILSSLESFGDNQYRKIEFLKSVYVDIVKILTPDVIDYKGLKEYFFEYESQLTYIEKLLAIEADISSSRIGREEARKLELHKQKMAKLLSVKGMEKKVIRLLDLIDEKHNITINSKYPFKKLAAICLALWSCDYFSNNISNFKEFQNYISDYYGKPSCSSFTKSKIEKGEYDYSKHELFKELPKNKFRKEE